MAECLRCGGPVDEGTQRCLSCGTHQSEAAGQPAGAQSGAWTTEAPQAAYQQPGAGDAVPEPESAAPFGQAADLTPPPPQDYAQPYGQPAVADYTQPYGQPAAAPTPAPDYYGQQPPVPDYTQPYGAAPQQPDPHAPQPYVSQQNPYAPQPGQQPDNAGYPQDYRQPYGQPAAPVYPQPDYAQPPYGQPQQGGYPGQPAYNSPYGPAAEPYGVSKSSKRNLIIIIVAAVVCVALIGVCIYALFGRSSSSSAAGGLNNETRALIAELESEEQRAATRALEFLNAAKADQRGIVAGYVNPDKVEELAERLGTDEAAAAYLADQLTDRVLDINGGDLPPYTEVEVSDAGDWQSTCRITLQDGTAVTITLEMVYGEYYVVSVRGGSNALSPEALEMINTLYSDEEIAVAVRGMAFIEAVLAGDVEAVEESLHPDTIREAGEYNSMYGGYGSVGQMAIDAVESIIGRNASGYQRINIDLYSGGRADCDVYFIQAEDFLVIQVERYSDGEYYVVNFY